MARTIAEAIVRAKNAAVRVNIVMVVSSFRHLFRARHRLRAVNAEVSLGFPMWELFSPQ